MRFRFAFGVLGVLATLAIGLRAQDLAPRAYLITPVHGNAVILSSGFYNGGLDFNNAVPITGATGTYVVPTFSYYHSFDFLGRSANITFSLPYAVGTFGGDLIGVHHSVYRSGLADSVIRFAVNLKGGPAMTAPEFAKWRQKLILGASLKVSVPTGQYSSTKLVNWGANRWGFKPEFGYSQRFGHWVLDAYGGAWFYTQNHSYYDLPIPVPQSQQPIGSFEGHLSYTLTPRAWVSLDGNYWWGGVTSLNGISNLATRQTSSRVGVTAALPISKSQSIKISYNDGAYIRYGGNYNSVSVAWQFSWLGHPK
jgi:hypothetical protein